MKKITALVLVVLMALGLWACVPSPAKVADSTATAAPAKEETAPAKEEPAAVEPAPAEEPAAVEPAPAEEPAAVEPAPAEEPAPAVEPAPAEEPAAAAPAVTEPVKLEVWYAISGTSGDKFTALSDAYQQSQELVTLEMSYSGGSNDTATKVSAAQLSGTLPDMALMYAGPLYTGGKEDFSMAELIKEEGYNADDIYPGMWDYCNYMSAGVCAIPYGISTQVMYYNKDILASAGVDMTNPPKTWAEFYDVCKQCVEQGSTKSGEAVVGFDVSDAPWLFKSMLMQNGCSIIEVNDGLVTPIYDNEQALQVAEYWKSLIDGGIMLPGEHENAENKFLAGNCAFIAATSNRISRWNGAVEFELGAIEMPSFSTPSLALGGNVLVIFTQDPVRRAACWDYVKYLTGTENIADFALSTGYLPIRKSAVETPAAQEAIKNNEMYAVAFKQLDYTWSYVHFEQMGTMDSEIRGALNKIEKGVGGSISDVLKKSVQKLQIEIDEG